MAFFAQFPTRRLENYAGLSMENLESLTQRYVFWALLIFFHCFWCVLIPPKGRWAYRPFLDPCLGFPSRCLIGFEPCVGKPVQAAAPLLPLLYLAKCCVAPAAGPSCSRARRKTKERIPNYDQNTAMHERSQKLLRQPTKKRQRNVP